MDWNSRAKEVISLVTYYYHQAEVSKMKGVLTDAECVEAQEKYKDQALSELASIVEEEAIQLLRNIKSIEYPPSGKEYHFTDGGWSNNVSSIVRDQLSNRRSDE